MVGMNKLLLIDDDQELASMLRAYLQQEGFDIDMAHDGELGLQMGRTKAYSAIVLDIMLPLINGIDVLKQLRASTNTPVIMLTGKGDDLDRIIGLELGADDYLPKPCNPRELLARIKAVLRRSQLQPLNQEVEPSELIVGQLKVDSSQYQAFYNGSDLGLTKAEFNVLKVLTASSNQVISKEVLYDQALGRTFAAYDRSLDMHISNIRKKLTSHCNDDLIVSIRGVGYKLQC